MDRWQSSHVIIRAAVAVGLGWQTRSLPVARADRRLCPWMSSHWHGIEKASNKAKLEALPETRTWRCRRQGPAWRVARPGPNGPGGLGRDSDKRDCDSGEARERPSATDSEGLAGRCPCHWQPPSRRPCSGTRFAGIGRRPGGPRRPRVGAGWGAPPAGGPEKGWDEGRRGARAGARTGPRRYLRAGSGRAGRAGRAGRPCPDCPQSLAARGQAHQRSS